MSAHLFMLPLRADLRNWFDLGESNNFNPRGIVVPPHPFLQTPVWLLPNLRSEMVRVSELLERCFLELPPSHNAAHAAFDK